MKVSLKDYSKPLFATKCTGGYWISYEYGKFLKNDSGKIKVFTHSEVEEFHELYKLDYPVQYKQDLAKREAVENGTPVPMFTARYDDPQSMDVLKKVFGKSSLDTLGDDPNELKERLNSELNRK
jgi:hypothetical protein